MTNSIQKFQFQKGKQEIRTAKKDGEIFFCLKDVCNALGLNNSSQVFSRVDHESGRYIKMTHPQSPSKMLEQLKTLDSKSEEVFDEMLKLGIEPAELKQLKN